MPFRIDTPDPAPHPLHSRNINLSKSNIVPFDGRKLVQAGNNVATKLS